MSSLLCMSCAFSASYILVMLVIDIMIWEGLNLCWDCLRDRFIKVRNMVTIKIFFSRE